MLPSSALAQEPAATFYAGQKYTYCDAKVLAHFWSGSTSGDNIWEAKVSAGEMILNRQTRALDQKIRAAAQMFSQAGQSCEFEDADNPPYSYDDAVSLASYWNKEWNDNMTPYDAKMKIILNVEGGGNSWVLGELAKAR